MINCDSYLFPELIFTETRQLQEANYTVVLQVNDTSLQRAASKWERNGTVCKQIKRITSSIVDSQTINETFKIIRLRTHMLSTVNESKLSSSCPYNNMKIYSRVRHVRPFVWSILCKWQKHRFYFIHPAKYVRELIYFDFILIKLCERGVLMRVEEMNIELVRRFVVSFFQSEHVRAFCGGHHKETCRIAQEWEKHRL